MLDNLKKVRGFSFEDVVKVIEDKEVKYKVRTPPEPSGKQDQIKYFRDSRIIVPEENDLMKIVDGLPGWWGKDYWVRNETLFVRAFYEILPGFDYKQLDGAVPFKKGLGLVERVRVEKGDRFDF